MESIPNVLQYGVSQSMFRTNEMACYPQEGNQSQNGRYTVKLPSKSIVDLSSLRAVWDLAVSVTADATNYTNAALPAAWQLFRSIQFVVGGSAVSGHQCQHYNSIYTALVKASGNIEWLQNHLNEGANVLKGVAFGNEFDNTNAALNANPTVASKTSRMSMNDFLGLPHGNGGDLYLDTSLFGDVSVIFELDNNTCIPSFQGGTGAIGTINFTLSNFVVNVKTVTSVSPLYVELLAMKLKSKSPIRIPFENMISSLQNNGTAARLSVNTSCLDKFLLLPHVENPATNAANPSSSTLSINKFTYNSGRDKTNANATRLQVRIGSESYPKQQIQNAMDIAAITEDTISGSAADRNNLLFLGINAGVNAYNRNYFLADNCVFYQKYCLQEGWAHGKNLTGISSNGSQLDIQVDYQNFGAYQLLCAFVTSQLIYDPESGTVSVEQ